MPKKVFTITGKLWRYTVEPASWFFVYVDRDAAEAVRAARTKTVGFHSVPIEAAIGKTKWRTTLFPTKDKLYLLAVKASVRKQEDLREGDTITASFRLV